MSSSTTSLSHLLRDAIARHAAAGRTALLGPFGSTSYARLGAQVDGYASAMRGVTRGEPVGILGSRSVESVALFFGIMQAGGCPCFMEPGLETDAVVRRMKAVGMHRIVLEDESQSMTRGLEQGGRRVRHLADLSPLTADSERGVVESLTTSDRAMLQFTSGSTGQPKGVPLSHGNLRCQADGIIAHTSLTPADRLLHVIRQLQQTHHVADCRAIHAQTLRQLFNGSTESFKVITEGVCLLKHVEILPFEILFDRSFANLVVLQFDHATRNILQTT